MLELTRALLWIFVFSLPWETLASSEWLGTSSRLIGLIAATAGVLTALMRGRIRRPRSVVWLAAAFVFANVLSLLWTVSLDASVERIFTYAQLFALLWLIWEFAAVRGQQDRLMLAYCLGAFIPLAGLFLNYIGGVHIRSLSDDARYSVRGINADDLGLMLALGIPMAWHLLLTGRKLARVTGGLYCALAMAGILLTATRGAFLAALAALSIVPFSLWRQSVRAAALATAALVVAALMLVAVTPVSSWNRILSIRDELAGGGTLSGRLDIWKAGWTVFEAHPLLGVGAGAFPAAVEPMLDRPRPPHNVFLAILVEQGVAGFSFFAALCAVCVWLTWSLPPPHRALWTALMLAWFVGAMFLGWHYAKTTWLLFGLLAAQSAVSRAPARTWEPADATRRTQINYETA